MVECQWVFSQNKTHENCVDFQFKVQDEFLSLKQAYSFVFVSIYWLKYVSTCSQPEYVNKISLLEIDFFKNRQKHTAVSDKTLLPTKECNSLRQIIYEVNSL